MTTRILGSAALALLLVAACATDPPLTVCTRELRVHFTPSDTSIVVDQAFTASVQLSGCGGAETLSDILRWHSENPAVATVDSLSGRVVGEGPGATRIAANGQSYGRVGSLGVSVQPDTVSL